MTAPTSSISSILVTQSNSQNINALLASSQWGISTGSGMALSYSFPWSSGSALFAGVGNDSYSNLNEPSATYVSGLNAIQQSAARAALQAWADVANITLMEVADTASDVGDIRLAWTSASEAMSDGSEPWGWAYEPNDYWPSGGDIWISLLNPNSAGEPWSPGSYNYEALLHELGHALGLKHPFEGTVVLPESLDNRLYTIMSYTDPANNIYPSVGYVNGTYEWVHYSVIPETPMVLDIAAIQYLYGANNSYHVGNDIYTLEADNPFFKTLWDAGGTDTLAASDFTLSCLIDLTPGHYSSLRIPEASDTGGQTPTYDGTNNLGIAYGCIIENAIGGNGDDTLIGNSSGNQLSGGAGNDTMDGGAGIDTAIFNGSRAAYTVNTTSTVFTVSGGNDGTDTLSNIERLQFSDGLLAFDIDANAGQVYRLYKAAFDRIPDTPGLGYWIKEFDAGANTMLGIANGFIASAEFQTLYGSASTVTDRDFITLLYNNVLDRVPDQAGFDYWEAEIARGFTHEALLTSFSESAENKSNVLNAITNGIWYV